MSDALVDPPRTPALDRSRRLHMAWLLRAIPSIYQTHVNPRRSGTVSVRHETAPAPRGATGAEDRGGRSGAVTFCVRARVVRATVTVVARAEVTASTAEPAQARSVELSAGLEPGVQV